MIQLHDAHLHYRQPSGIVPVLDGFTLQIPKGERWVLIGPSGCGKSTLLLLIAGLIQPNEGRIQIDGSDITGPREHTSLILQDYGLFPWKTVAENVALGLRVKGWRKSEAIRRALHVVERLGLGGLEHRYPRQLSGGQRQRVAVGRALTMEPDLLLMDEPFSSLDALTRESLQNLILEISSREQLTILLVTHSIEEAAFLGQRILVLDGPPLRVIGTVNNQSSGISEYRGHPSFYQTCNQIRCLLNSCLVNI